jgi:Transposase DDE domain
MTEMVTSGSMSGERKRSDGLLGECDSERRRLRQAPPVLHATASLLDSTSNQVLVDLAALDLRTYIAEPDRGRRRWRKKAEARDAVYANRRRIRGARGRALQRRRSERLERPNAHLYETGGMRRTHLRGHDNILKRLFVHSGGFNLGLVMRTLIGVGTPRGLQGRLTALVALLMTLRAQVVDAWRHHQTPSVDYSAGFSPHHRCELLPIGASEWAV